MKVLIIEDEPLAQEEIERLLLKKYPHFTVVGKIASVEDSIQWLQQNTCDLLLMDIRLEDGMSFDIFKHVSVKTPIIFTTAYDQFAIQAFQHNSIGYVLKPIDETELSNAVEKFLHHQLSPYSESTLQQIATWMQKKAHRQRIVAKLGDRYIHLNVAEIAYFYSEDKTTFARLKNNKNYIIDLTLDKLEPEVDPTQFFRVARNVLCSAKAIEEVAKYFNSRLQIELQPAFNQKVLVSRARVSDFLNWLNQ